MKIQINFTVLSLAIISIIEIIYSDGMYTSIILWILYGLYRLEIRDNCCDDNTDNTDDDTDEEED